MLSSRTKLMPRCIARTIPFHEIIGNWRVAKDMRTRCQGMCLATIGRDHSTWVADAELCPSGRGVASSPCSASRMATRVPTSSTELSRSRIEMSMAEAHLLRPLMFLHTVVLLVAMALRESRTAERAELVSSLCLVS